MPLHPRRGQLTNLSVSASAGDGAGEDSEGWGEAATTEQD